MFWGYSKSGKWISTQGLNRSQWSNVWWLKSATHMTFTEECIMFMGKHLLTKKMFTNWLNMALPLQAWVNKTVHGVETQWFWQFSGTWKDPSLDFFEKGATINSCFYCQLSRQNSPYLLNDSWINPFGVAHLATNLTAGMHFWP